jgi:hypothetical protein
VSFPLGASFWGPFILGVAVTVAGWVIIKLLGGTWDWLTKRKKREEEAKARHYTDRSAFRAGLTAVASELKDCAHIAHRCESGQVHVPSEVEKLRATEWFDRRNDLIMLRDEDKALWDEGEEIYRELRRSKQSGGHPPKSDDLLAFSSRLLDKLAQEGRPQAGLADDAGLHQG